MIQPEELRLHLLDSKVEKAIRELVEPARARHERVLKSASTKLLKAIKIRFSECGSYAPHIQFPVSGDWDTQRTNSTGPNKVPPSTGW